MRRWERQEEDEVIAFETANEDGEGRGKQEVLGRGMAHLLPIPLGLHNHLPGSHFSLIQPLTRRARERERVFSYTRKSPNSQNTKKEKRQSKFEVHN